MPVVTETYDAVVTSNADDEKRGRIKVSCPDLVGDLDDELIGLPMFIEPVFDWGWFVVPDVGEIVEIEVVVTSDQDESFMQATLDGLRPRWRAKRHYTAEEGLEDNHEVRLPHSDFVSENYGKRRGFATPFGHVLMIDDTESAPRIQLTWIGEQLEPGGAPEDAKISRMEFEPDGSYKLTLLDKHTLHLQTEDNKLELQLDGGKHTIALDADAPSVEVSLAEGDHTMTLDDGQFTANVGGGSSIRVEGSGGDAATTLGDGAVHAAIAEAMETWWNDTIKPAIEGMHNPHAHPLAKYIIPLIPVSEGPVIPDPGGDPDEKPIEPADLPSYDSGITSGKLSFPEG